MGLGSLLFPLQQLCPLLLLYQPEFVFTEEVIDDTVEAGGRRVREELLTAEGGLGLTDFTLSKLVNILHHLRLRSGYKDILQEAA